MLGYLFKVLTLLVFSFFVIYNYYIVYPVHVENFDGYFIYIVIVGFLYLVYKSTQLLVAKNKVSFTPLSIYGYFLLHLFVLCCLFFSFNNLGFGNGFILFFKILFYTLFPTLIVLSSISFGFKMISYIKNIGEESKIFKFILSLGIGFSSFLFLLAILGLSGFYNLFSVFGILIFFISFSYKNFINVIKGLFSYKINFEGHLPESKSLIKNFAPKLLTTEFLFIVSSLLLSVNLISIIRPFPIGWDDLGAYMNVPNLLSKLGVIEGLGGLISWQSFTGIGFMFNSSTQAFFLNNVGGFLSFIVLVLIISDTLKDKKQTFINIPMLVSTIFISLPMVIFQQAKDMKLDIGLFFITIVSIYLFYNVVIGFKNKIELTKFKKLYDYLLDKKIILLFIVGFISGLAFTIKVTSVLLIFSLIGVLFFYEYGILAFLGFTSILFSLLTKFHIWDYMNVVYPKDDKDMINNFFIIGTIIGLTFFFNIYKKGPKVFLNFFMKLLVFGIGIIIAILPWATKNIIDTFPNVSVGSIVGGKSTNFEIDYTKIHSESEIKKIEEQGEQERMTESGKSQNEDFGRYFGYEDGINNYIKLPWNLTMQKNQGGEFTDISFLFLALLPVLLLFLPFKNKYYSLGILLFLLLEILIFVFDYFKGSMSLINLPFGYLVIYLIFLIPLFYFIFSLKKGDRLVKLFKVNLIFASLYIFLWSISAFGIVWYGIGMYFCFILMIALSAYYLSSFNYEEYSKKKINIKFIGSFILFFIILIHLFSSTIPHAFNNLKKASYNSYKLGDITQEESIFVYHREYLPMLSHLNLKEELFKEFILSKLKDSKINEISKIRKIVKENDISVTNFVGLIKQLYNNSQDIKEKRELKSIERSIYKGIVKPEEKYKSDDIVYRIGTFIKYFISENNKRVYSDNLINGFNTYIFDKNGDINKTVENIKKLGLSYFLVDLNAATIDKDPRHDLTKRFEKLLYTFTSDKLELIETDSICLKIALENYNKSKKTDKDYSDYMVLAGVNYESYLADNKVVERGRKLAACYDYIIQLVDKDRINNENYNYLLGIKQYILNKDNKINTKKEKYGILQRAVSQGYKALFMVK